MEFLNELHRWIGPDSSHITWWQMSLRAALVFFYGLILFGLMRRSLRQRGTIDVVIAVILGSVLSRGVTGNAAFLPVLAASAALVILHNAVAYLACRSALVDRLLKQDVPIPLVRDGKLDRKGMLKGLITEPDIHSAARHHGLERLDQIKAAYLEPTGSISIISKSG